MQDTLRNLAKISVQKIVSSMERLAPVEIAVHSVSEATCVFRDTFQHPVLAVEIRPADGLQHFDFVLHPQRFVSTALDAYNAGLQFLNEVFPLERLMIPPRLQSSEAPSLIEVFQFDELWVQDGLERLKNCLDKACLGPSFFLKKLQLFEPLLKRDPAAMVDTFFKDEPTDEEIQDAISKERFPCGTACWEVVATINRCDG